MSHHHSVIIQQQHHHQHNNGHYSQDNQSTTKSTTTATTTGILRDEVEEETIAKVKSLYILIISSDTSSHAPLQHVLTDYGYDVVVVTNIDDAINCLTRDEAPNRFDVILLDLEGCTDDPILFVTNLRENEMNTKHYSAVLALSSSAIIVEDVKNENRDIDAVLQKPVSVKQLMRSIEQCVEISLNYADSVDMNLAMEQCGGDDEFLKELLGELVEGGKNQIAGIRRFIDLLDWENLNLESHSLKGAAAQLACKPLAQAAFILERAAKLRETDGLEESYEKVVERLSELKSFLSQ